MVTEILGQSIGLGIVGISAIVIVMIFLKGWAMWDSARNNKKAWFIALLILNTAGILPAIYLIWFRRKR